MKKINIAYILIPIAAGAIYLIGSYFAYSIGYEDGYNYGYSERMLETLKQTDDEEPIIRYNYENDTRNESR